MQLTETIPTQDGIVTGRSGTFDNGGLIVQRINHDLFRIDCTSRKTGKVLNAGMSFDRHAAQMLIEELCNCIFERPRS
jgi:hypothetical protein